MAAGGTVTNGTVALAGSGEFLPAMVPLDSALLRALPPPWRVVIVPTASAPDGPGVPERWGKLGVDHFAALGASAEAVLVRTRVDAADEGLAARIASANFVYLSGGKPRYLLDTLRETACWRAIVGVYAAGGVVAGCSAGAMALAGRMVDFPRVWRTLPGLGLAPEIAVIPHFDEMPGWLVWPMRRTLRRGTVVGIPGATCLVGHPGAWRAAGKGQVVVFQGGRATAYGDGEPVAL
ncbi:MAG TPA: Type 1 glutamine amidotransferase-like domain-containing protein [Ktedonobacterales bacterium]|jgi:cyanophycinase